MKSSEYPLRQAPQGLCASIVASGVILFLGIVRAVALNRVMMFYFVVTLPKGVRGNEN